MAKKQKITVNLPGGIAGLVHTVQRGESAPAREESRVEEQPVAPENEQTPQSITEQTVEKPSETSQSPSEEEEKQEKTAPVKKETPVTKPAGDKKQKNAKAEREYHVTKDDSKDSWELFLDLARDFKEKDSKLATIYIDRDLKNVLDRLKAATSVKLPTTALLSAIVTRFVYDHEKQIKDAIFGDRLI